ncbi:hypothetical protein BV22DRAFT_1196659 [Leucogyrophana mollusca]|uniref:Uncharacterized protein n=1 Tax=Leucogyrophana mollusca TaxID=85980 RepID=A0ACB8BCI6_9AGAM|nr:hypothetical protein BV22DRAFT_1196659 [Leucogyrophana mollusca]
MSDWDPNAVKSLLRQTAQRLGQLQERKDSQGQITRRDIATLLQQGNIGLARAKAQNLIHDDATGDLLEMLEMHVGVLLEHLGELAEGRTPAPTTVEAASSIIFAAPHTESKDLNMVRGALVQRMGPHFARSASGNRDNHVSSRIAQILSAPPPSAAKMNDCLSDIAKAYGIKWSPEPRRQDILNSISEILDAQSSPLVDLPRLRRLCSQGIPDDPPWLRPRIWRLFFGALPVLKSTWVKETQKQRDSYYDLVRRLLTPLSDSPPPSKHSTPSDATVVKVSESIFRLPPELFYGLDNEPDSSNLCPLDEAFNETDRVACSKALDSRLQAIRELDSDASRPTGIPEIRLESDGGLDLSASTSSSESLASRTPAAPTTLLHGKNFSEPAAHPKHLSALLRLLYIHTCLNPANQSPHIPSLLVPLYSAVIKEIEPQDVAHAEADTFWLFEAVVGEFSELEDQEGGKVWMKKFSERLSLADGELAASLHAKGLDPALPHYSYRWLAPLLSQTLPLTSVYPVWDVLFSCPMRTRDVNPKLDLLVDVCISLLIRARTPLFRLGKPGHKSPGLWVEEHAALTPPSPLRPWELSDAFLQGMTLLQSYPIEAAGGIDRVLQTASDLAQKRIEDSKAQKNENLSLGARLKVTMWKGFTNQVTAAEESSPEEELEEEEEESEEDSHDDGNETETPAAPGLTSRLANTVWRGITNQSSMEAPPSPPSGEPSPLPSPPSSPSPSPSQPALPLPDDKAPPSSTPQSPGIWGYAGKLKDSDTIAAFAKVSTNWRAKALDAWGNRRGSTSIQGADTSSPASTTSELPPRTNGWMSPDLRASSVDSGRRGSLPSVDRSSPYSPPPRPAVFRSPRESFLPQPRRQESSAPPSPEAYPRPESSFAHKTKASLASLAAFQSHPPPPPPPPKSGPRPLLLNSNSLITAPKSPLPVRSDSNTPVSHQGQWSEVLLAKGHASRQASVTSLSSLSPSEAFNRPYPRPRVDSRSDHDVDSGSRRVALNRKSVSPMAPPSRSPRAQWASPRSSVNSSDAGMPSPSTRSQSGLTQSSILKSSIAEDARAEGGFYGAELPDSPTTISSPPIPPTPITAVSSEVVDVHVSNGEHQRGSSSLSESPFEPPSHSRVMIRKKTPPPPMPQEVDDTSDSSLSRTPSSKSPRLRSKRYAARPANIRTRENPRTGSVAEQKTLNPNSLAPEWPDEQHELATTPRASDFGSNEPSSASPTSPRSQRQPPSRKTSGESEGQSRKAANDGSEVRRKISTDGHSARARKISTSSRDTRRRDSAAEEGDDEGYDDLLSAYESEEGSRK